MQLRRTTPMTINTTFLVLPFLAVGAAVGGWGCEDSAMFSAMIDAPFRGCLF
jgi:hypothetical protein